LSIYSEKFRAEDAEKKDLMALKLVLNIISISVSGIMIFYLLYKMPEILRKQKKGELPKYQIIIIAIIILFFILIIIERIEKIQVL